MKRMLIWAAIAAMTPAAPAFAELVVIVNPKNPVASTTADEVASLYLGRATTFRGGAAATPIDVKEGNATRDEFYGKVADKSPGQLKAYRAKQMFSGKGAPPQELASVSEVKKAVAADPSAIGYIDKSALDSTVKSVLAVP